MIKLAVIGDSRATNHGLPESVRPFPLLIGDLAEGAIEVRNYAKTGLLLDRFLPNVGQVVEWRPDIVLAAIGGRETVYRIPRYLKKVPIPIGQSITGRGWWLPRSWLRRQVWRCIVWPLQHYPRLGEHLMQLLRARPYRTPAQYAAAVSELLAALAPTGATLVLLEHFDTFQSHYIWKPSHRAANTKLIREVAASSGGGILTLDLKEIVDFRGIIISDGVHLSEEGHLAVARALLNQLLALGSPGQLAGPPALDKLTTQ